MTASTTPRPLPDQVVDIFDQAYNCTQSVLLAMAPRYGLDPDLACRLATAMGIGGSRGEQCGAVSGALLVLGLEYGGGGPDGAEAKAFSYHKAREYLRLFAEKRGTLVCRELLGADPSTPEGLAQARSQGLFQNVCHGVLRDAAQILEEVLARD